MRKTDKLLIKIKNAFIENMKDECGMGVIEVTLIVVVLVGLAIIFKSEITSIATSVFTHLKGEVNSFK